MNDLKIKLQNTLIFKKEKPYTVIDEQGNIIGTIQRDYFEDYNKTIKYKVCDKCNSAMSIEKYYSCNKKLCKKCHDIETQRKKTEKYYELKDTNKTCNNCKINKKVDTGYYRTNIYLCKVCVNEKRKKYIKPKDGKRFTINKVDKEVIKKIIEDFNNGLSSYKIAEKYKEHGIKQRTLLRWKAKGLLN